jgi:hypothetical protein
MPDEVIGDEVRIVRAARASEGNLSRLRTFPRQGIKCFPAATGAEEKSSEHSGTGERKQPGIGPRGRTEAGNDLRLLAVDYPHY